VAYITSQNFISANITRRASTYMSKLHSNFVYVHFTVKINGSSFFFVP
jgi:hypothetical protein